LLNLENDNKLRKILKIAWLYYARTI
jgi:hypothetical protein